MDRNEAAEALASAEGANRHTARSGSWYVAYCGINAAVSAACTFAIGMATAPWGPGAATAVLLAAMGALTVYGIRRPVTPHGFARLHGGCMAVWGALYATAIVTGFTAFPQNAAWWGPAALATAIPFAAAGALSAARARRAL